jgi:hypothetical protein
VGGPLGGRGGGGGVGSDGAVEEMMVVNEGMGFARSLSAHVGTTGCFHFLSLCVCFHYSLFIIHIIHSSFITIHHHSSSSRDLSGFHRQVLAAFPLEVRKKLGIS